MKLGFFGIICLSHVGAHEFHRLPKNSHFEAPKMEVENESFLFKQVIFRFHVVSFVGGVLSPHIIYPDYVIRIPILWFVVIPKQGRIHVCWLGGVCLGCGPLPVTVGNEGSGWDPRS